MKRPSPKLQITLIAFLLTVALDQGSKFAVDENIERGARVPVIDGFFYITHERNPGAAFGLLRDVSDEWRWRIFAVVSLVAFAVMFSFYRNLAPGERFTALVLALVLGGASGNFIDRLWRGEVIDFLHFRLWGGYPWPDFNLADAFIVVGVAGLMLDLVAAEGASRAADN